MSWADKSWPTTCVKWYGVGGTEHSVDILKVWQWMDTLRRDGRPLVHDVQMHPIILSSILRGPSNLLTPTQDLPQPLAWFKTVHRTHLLVDLERLLILWEE